ncbi:MAG: polymer-forming cytoskeletal protein, partial [Deltaproteobacteria bacterium]|nr:polymer-forming cytoskeletal protein [Deltaproteobacteria bacterium]
MYPLKKLLLMGFLILSLPLFPLQGAEEFHSMMKKGGNVYLHLQEQVQDIVVVDGNVHVDGEVHGSITVVGGNVHLSPTSKVEKTINVYQGDLYMAPGAGVRQTISIFGGQLSGWNPEIYKEQKGLPTPHIISKELVNEEMIELLKRYAVMNRSIPLGDL